MISHVYRGWKIEFSEKTIKLRPNRIVSHRDLVDGTKNSKNYSLNLIFSGTLPFFDRNSQKVKIFEKNFDKFFGGIDSESFKTYFKPNKLVPKKFPVDFFSGTLSFLAKIAKSEIFQKKTLMFVELIRSSLGARMAHALSSD